LAVSNPPAFLDTQSYSAQYDRRWVGYDFLEDASGVAMTTSRGGVVNVGDMSVTQNGTPNMSVNVAAGAAYVRGTSISNQGIYRCVASSTTNLAITTAHASLARWDLVVARVYDNTHDSSGQNKWELEIVTGTPAGSPAEPTLPASSFKLARVTVGAAVSTIVTGNISNVSTQLRMKSSVTAPDLIKASNFGAQMVFGHTTINLTSGQGETVTTVSYGATFSAVPNFICSIDDAMGNPYVVHANKNVATTTQTSVGIRKGDGSNFSANATTDISWIAIGV
jgi:hypothetical protein